MIRLPEKPMSQSVPFVDGCFSYLAAGGVVSLMRILVSLLRILGEMTVFRSRRGALTRI